MNKEFVKELTKLTSNINALEDMGVQESASIYVEQLDRLKEITNKASDEEFDQDMENVAGKIPNVESMVELDEVSEFKDKQFANLIGKMGTVDSPIGISPKDPLHFKAGEGEDEEGESYPCMCHECEDSGCSECEDEEDEEDEDPRVTDEQVERMVNLVVKDIRFNEEEEKSRELFQSVLLKAVKQVMNTGAHSDFYVNVQGEMVEGKIKPHDGGFNMSLGHNQYYLTPESEDTGGDDPEEMYSPSLDQRAKDLLEDIEVVDIFGAGAGLHDILQDIETVLDSKSEEGLKFTENDYKLMRYFLGRHALEDNSIDEVSNRGLQLAWSRRRYMNKAN